MLVSPRESFIKLNIDGRVQGNPQLVGVGCTIRDAQVMWIWGFSMHLGSTTSTQV